MIQSSIILHVHTAAKKGCLDALEWHACWTTIRADHNKKPAGSQGSEVLLPH